MPEDTNDQPEHISPIVLAFVGDAVFALFVRERLVRLVQGSVHQIHLKSTSYVRASAQHSIIVKLSDSFTEKEQDIYRRGRNAKSATLPKNANLQEYRHATGFEALLGYLYLAGEHSRLNELMENAALIIEAAEIPGIYRPRHKSRK